MDVQTAPANMSFNMTFDDFQRIFAANNPLERICKWLEIRERYPYRVIGYQWKQSPFTQDGQPKMSLILTIQGSDHKVQRVWAAPILVKSLIEKDIDLAKDALIVVNFGERVNKLNNRTYHSAGYLLLDLSAFEEKYCRSSQQNPYIFATKEGSMMVCIYICSILFHNNLNRLLVI